MTRDNEDSVKRSDTHYGKSVEARDPSLIWPSAVGMLKYFENDV